MSKHTPGPWEISDCGEHIIGQADQDDIHEVADLSNSLNHEANARLIAAAPEMLELLKGILEAGEHGGGVDFDAVALLVKKAEDK